MRPNVQYATRGSGAVPLSRSPANANAVAGRLEASAGRGRLTIAGVGFLVYLWVIHSGKAPIGAAAIVLGLAGLVLQRERLRLPAPVLWFVAFLLWASFGYVSALGADRTADSLWDYTKIGLIFLLALNVAHSKSQFRWMMLAWLGIFALYPVRGTLFNIVFGITIQGRYAWNFAFSNPNDLTTLSLPILAMSVAMLQTQREKWFRMCALAGTIILPILMFTTQSRGGILALFTFGALVLVHYRKRIGGMALIVMIAGAVIQVAPPEVWGRIASLSKVTSQTTIGEADKWGSAQQRSDIWKVARAMIADHPITGVGVGNYGEMHARYANTGQFQGAVQGRRDAHSTYLGTAAETGIPGLMLFLAMIGSVFVLGWRAVGRLKESDPATATGLRTLLFGLIAFLQACLFATVTHLAFLYLYLAVICTMVAVHQASPAASIGKPRLARRS